MKKITAILTAFAMVSVLAIGASAAKQLSIDKIDLGTTQLEWGSHGTDSQAVRDFSMDELKAATAFVVEFNGVIGEGANGALICFGSPDWDWGGGQNNLDFTGYLDGDNKLYIPLAGLIGFDGVKNGTVGATANDPEVPGAKIAFAFWSGGDGGAADLEELEVTSIYLDGVSDQDVGAAPADDGGAAPAPADSGNGGDAGPVGDKGSTDTGAVGIATVCGLAILSAGAVIVSKKRK